MNATRLRNNLFQARDEALCCLVPFNSKGLQRHKPTAERFAFGRQGNVGCQQGGLMEVPNPVRVRRTPWASGFLQLHLKSFNLMSSTLHRLTILLYIAAWTGVKPCKKIVHDSLTS
jgi:hypothetical protein